jgi:F-type H+-transporting ATPase subunit b
MKRFVVSAALFAALLFSGAAMLHAQEKEATEKSGEMAEPDPVWKWANFVLLAAALGYLLNKTLPPLFKSRSEEIQKGIAEAQIMKQDADRRAAEVDARLRTLSSEIETFRANAKVEMQQEGERIRQETAGQIARLEQQASQEVEAASKAAQRELKSHAAALALELAEQRLRVQAGGAALVDGFIQDLSRKELKN